MYEPATGRFTTLDPFFGNLQDPQSFHKYLYTHGDPVNGSDPTGRETLVGMMSSMSVGSSLRANHSIATAIFGLEVAAGFVAGYYYGKHYGQKIKDIRAQPAPPREDYESALLSKAVYEIPPQAAAGTGWTVLREFDDPSWIGFRAVLFEKAGKYTLSFAGTDDLPDWISNVGQGLFGAAPQYSYALDVVQKAMDVMTTMRGSNPVPPALGDYDAGRYRRRGARLAATHHSASLISHA